MIGCLLATVGLISVWPVLGARTADPAQHDCGGIAAGLGFGLTRLSPHAAGMTAFWITITSVEALSLVASLLVVRSCGYRLVRLPSSRTVTKDAVA